MGVTTSHHPFLDGIFPCKPIQLWGSPWKPPDVARNTSPRGVLWIPWMAYLQPPPASWPRSSWNHWWISPTAGFKNRKPQSDVSIVLFTMFTLSKAIANHPKFSHKWVTNHQNIGGLSLLYQHHSCFLRTAKNQSRIEGSISSCVRMKLRCELYPLWPIQPHLPLGRKLPNAFLSTFAYAWLTQTTREPTVSETLQES